jgi:hypothetical protein
MSDEIKRSVNVAVDGKSKQFNPGPVPEGTSEETIGRLQRAGAFGEKPMASQGGAGTLEISGRNPVTATATADVATGGETTTDVRSVQSEQEQASAAEADGGGEIGSLGNTPDEINVDQMTVKELRAYAETKGINLEGTSDKASIVAAIKVATSAAPAA